MSTSLHRAAPRVAHSQGHTELAFSPDGRRIITTGNDWHLRLIPTTEVSDGDETDENPTLVEIHRGAVTCLDVTSTGIVTGSEDQSTCLFTPDGTLVRTVFRASLTIRDVALRPGAGAKVAGRRRWVAVASDELDIKLVDADDIMKTETLKGHTRSPKSVAFDPSGSFLLIDPRKADDTHLKSPHLFDAHSQVSTASDGVIRIWDVQARPPACVKTIEDCIAKSEPETGDLFRISWHPSGKWFAVAGKDRDILVFQKDGWKLTYSLKDGTGQIGPVAWSPNGTYILSTARETNQVSVWRPDVDRKAPVVSDKLKSRITGCAWHPAENDVCLTDVLGRMIYWKGAVPVDRGLPHPANVSEGEKRGLDALSKIFDESERKEPAPPVARAAALNDDILDDFPAEAGDDDGIDEDDDDNFVVDDDGAGYTGSLDGAGIKRYHEKGRKQALKHIGR
ncbi:WD40-repeat-containing domain protein, partial [Blyttiomyces helicus]